MKMRQLGRVGPTVSAIGVGCCPMSGLYGSRPEQDGIDAIHLAIELGVTLFDTADVYGNGHNERLVGRALRGRRDKVILATKFGGAMTPEVEDDAYVVRELKPSGVNGSPEYIRWACEGSLRRLGIETIDLYQQHRVDPSVPIEETIGAVAELINEGKVRYIGLCEIQPSDLRRAHATHPITSVQNEYSLFERGIERELLGVCDELGIGLIPFAPLSRGILGGSLNADSKLEPTDVRLSGLFPRVAPGHMEANSRIAGIVAEIAAKHQATSAQVALAWLLSRHPSIVPIPGSDQVAYVEENVKAPDVVLTASDLEVLDGLSALVDGDRYAPVLVASATAVTAPLAQ